MIHALVLGVTLQTFAHLSLADAERAAIAHSPDVAAASARVDEARANLAAAKASYGPALTANYNAAPQGGNAPGETIEQRLTTLGAQVTLGDLLAYAPAAAEANAQLVAAQADLRDAQRTERIAAISAYFGALDAHATLGAREAALTDARAQARAAKLRFDAGDAPKLDVVRADVAIALAQADLARARADVQNADDVLEQTAGLDPSALNTVDMRAPQPHRLAIEPSAAVASALASRPEIAAAQADVSAEEHAVEVARRGGLPLLTLSAGETSGTDSGINVHGPSANVQLTLPVIGAAHDRVLAERARLAQARAMLEKARRSVTIEVASAARTAIGDEAALRASDRALEQARAEFAAVREGYRSGASSSLDVESARVTYEQALVNDISARYALERAQATFELEIGDSHA
ncbi:MAG: TolC family protein [bacterium]|nr:TolC family protein [bacterium]